MTAEKLNRFPQSTVLKMREKKKQSSDVRDLKTTYSQFVELQSPECLSD